MVINSILLLLALNCHRWEKTTATPSGRKKKHIKKLCNRDFVSLALKHHGEDNSPE
jgi:hypothetical protein